MSSTTIVCPASSDERNLGVYYSALGWSLQGIATVFIALRLYSRAWLTRSAGSDDATIVIGLILCYIGQSGDEVAVQSGLGRHCTFIDRENFQNTLKWLYIDWMIAFPAFFFVRASVMLFTLRLLPRTKKRSQWIIYTAFFLNFAITLIALVSYGLHCQPLSAYWHPVEGSKCLSPDVLRASMQVNGILACIIDVVTAIIPAFLIYKVQMRRSTKIILDVIFLLGLITAALSIGRAASTSSATWSEDITWHIMPPNTFSLVESKLGMICASCPALRQMVSYYKRTRTILPSTERHAPGADFETMRHRVNVRDWFGRGKRDPMRAHGLLNAEKRRFGSGSGDSGHRFGATDPEDSPLGEFQQRVVNTVTRV